MGPFWPVRAQSFRWGGFQCPLVTFSGTTKFSVWILCPPSCYHRSLFSTFFIHFLVDSSTSEMCITQIVCARSECWVYIEVSTEIKCCPTCEPYAKSERLLWEMLWPLVCAVCCLVQLLISVLIYDRFCFHVIGSWAQQWQPVVASNVRDPFSQCKSSILIMELFAVSPNTAFWSLILVLLSCLKMISTEWTSDWVLHWGEKIEKIVAQTHSSPLWAFLPNVLAVTYFCR